MSKGMTLIEAFRAERLRQRQALREKAGDAESRGSGAEPAPAGSPPTPDTSPASTLSEMPVQSPARSLSLAELGLGPAMTMRLHQIGLHTVDDLADTDPATLRAALGEISRLLGVESWIATARQKRSNAASG